MNDSVSGRTDTPEGSNGGDEGPSKPATLKDKQCQYCHQPFTSSSLGRHLDQYLFKKKPDGVHDVEEIRRLRSGITRRTARNSSTGRRESPDPSSSMTPNSAVKQTAAASSSIEQHGQLQLNGKPAKSGGYQVLLNQPTWHATGVMNDIPNTSHVSQLRVPAVSIDYGMRPSDKSGPETTRALELALREVLDNVKAAVTRTESRKSPFDFDLQTQTFPALCLQVLPAPPSLFSAHPFPSPTSFPLEPPGEELREVVQQSLLKQIQYWKSEQLAVAVSHSSQGPNNTGSPPPRDLQTIERSAQEHEEMTVRHLRLSLDHWRSLPRLSQQDMWRLEVMRAFAREKQKREDIEKQLARTQQEANQLRAQIDRLENCQWPREFAIFPPDMLPIPRDVSRQLTEDSTVNNIDASRWDYDNVVAKWKRVVMHDKSMGRAGSGVVTNIFADATSPAIANDNSHRRVSNNGNIRTSSQNHHGNIKPHSPQPSSVPITPDSPAQRYQTTNAQQQPVYQTRDPNRTDEPFRPPKRQRTGNNTRASKPSTQAESDTNRNANPDQSSSSGQHPSSRPAGYPATPSTAIADASSPVQTTKASPIGGTDKPYQHTRSGSGADLKERNSNNAGGSSGQERKFSVNGNGNGNNQAKNGNNTSGNGSGNAPGNSGSNADANTAGASAGHASNGLEMLMQAGAGAS
ncbi:hypothetical protein FQN55_007520 [Onygenales sp. PD_40]|nr:hypothetical protein FQN55_007520 [Onygenales sp. PD_40]